MSKKNRQSIAEMAQAIAEPEAPGGDAAPVVATLPPPNVITEPPPAPVQVVEMHWYEVQAGTLPKHDIQAPNEELAKWKYMQRMRITGPEPTAKMVA